jgi:hypothetical protein
MAKKSEQSHRDPDAFEQGDDGSGVVRLDRKLTAEEARAQDEANIAAYLEARSQRWFSPDPADAA